MSAFVVSKAHIDLLVQAAIAGPSDGHGFTSPSDPFSWYHDEQRSSVDARSDGEDALSPSQLGQILVNENVASVHGRYPDTEPDEGNLPGPVDAYYMAPYVFEPFLTSEVRVIAPGMPRVIPPPATIAELSKQLDCYEYQSCEHEGWEASEAHAVCRAMRDALLRSLPGYAGATWGVSVAG